MEKPKNKIDLKLNQIIFWLNTKVKFNSTGAKQVTLRVTDSDGYVCQVTKTVNVGLPLPERKEVTPE